MNFIKFRVLWTSSFFITSKISLSLGDSFQLLNIATEKFGTIVNAKHNFNIKFNLIEAKII